MDEKLVLRGYEYAKEVYAARGIDVDAAIAAVDGVPISMNCWQADDVLGFDSGDSLSGGIATTGNYPGRARTPDELRADADVAMSMIPGCKKFNLHASYAELGGRKVERSEYTAELFAAWMDWAAERGMGLDFNPTYFSHPMVKDGFTLSSPDKAVRDYWIEHGKRCREIGEAFYRRLGKECVINYWMPDGYKDTPADMAAPRARMIESLDAIFAGGSIEGVKEAVESKVFGLGLESYTVGSHELMMGYALSRGKLYCLDAGHFHPTEVISNKISSIMQFMPEALLHVSRPVRWDSDHVVTMDDELMAIMQQVVRGGYTDRVKIALDFFDASINRLAAWIIGTRNARKALLRANLENTAQLKELELAGDLTGRLALMEEDKTLPFGAVWDYYCLKAGVPVGDAWLDKVRDYEKQVMLSR
ncbi:MAG: L-rhamnose isomerase [Candidatus Fimadaptatus sp.]